MKLKKGKLRNSWISFDLELSGKPPLGVEAFDVAQTNANGTFYVQEEEGRLKLIGYLEGDASVDREVAAFRKRWAEAEFWPAGAQTVKISKERSVAIAIAAFQDEIGMGKKDDWLREENITTFLIRCGDDAFWCINWSASPIAGGDGEMIIDAGSGEVSRLRVASRLR